MLKTFFAIFFIFLTSCSFSPTSSVDSESNLTILSNDSNYTASGAGTAKIELKHPKCLMSSQTETDSVIVNYSGAEKTPDNKAGIISIIGGIIGFVVKLLTE